MLQVDSTANNSRNTRENSECSGNCTQSMDWVAGVPGHLSNYVSGSESRFSAGFRESAGFAAGGISHIPAAPQCRLYETCRGHHYRRRHPRWLAPPILPDIDRKGQGLTFGDVVKAIVFIAGGPAKGGDTDFAAINGMGQAVRRGATTPTAAPFDHQGRPGKSGPTDRDRDNRRQEGGVTAWPEIATPRIL